MGFKFRAFRSNTSFRKHLTYFIRYVFGTESHFYKTAPDYIKQRFDKMYILSDLFRSYFSSNIPLSDNNSLLASMLYYGKIHYLISSMLPNYSSHIIMGYTKEKCNGALGMKRIFGLIL